MINGRRRDHGAERAHLEVSVTHVHHYFQHSLLVCSFRSYLVAARSQGRYITLFLSLYRMVYWLQLLSNIKVLPRLASVRNAQSSTLTRCLQVFEEGKMVKVQPLAYWEFRYD